MYLAVVDEVEIAVEWPRHRWALVSKKQLHDAVSRSQRASRLSSFTSLSLVEETKF